MTSDLWLYENKRHEIKKNPGGSEFSAPVQTALGANPASYTMGTRSFSKDKAAEACGFDNPPILTSRLKKKYTYNSNSPCAFMSGCRVNGYSLEQ